MMNNRVTRIIANTVGLAAVAALGITVYQLGTSPIKEEPQKQAENTVQSENTDDQSMVDAGTDKVESENQPLSEDEGNLNDTELTSGAGNSDENTEVNLNGEINSNNVDNGEAEASADVDKNNSGSIGEGVQGETDNAVGEATDVSASAINLPLVNFSEDTLMEWPVNGNILLDYSMDQTTYFQLLISTN